MDSAGSAVTSYGYTSEWTDATGLVYLRARYYAPGQGRFLSRDVWDGDYSQPLTLNKWLYVSANPTNYYDPSGNKPQPPPHVSRKPCTAKWHEEAINERVDMAEKYVYRTRDPIDTYVAAGIAIQCAGSDNPLNPNSGLGIAQVSQNQAQTEWKVEIPLKVLGIQVYTRDKDGRPVAEIRCHGLRLRCPDGELEEALDPNNPKDAIILMKRRIQMVINACENCTDTDRYIAAALAQNGPGFTHINMQTLPKLKSTAGKLYNRNWQWYFETSDPEDTKIQLYRFDLVISELRSRRWIVPFIDSDYIYKLKNM